MEISWHGNTCFRLKNKDVTLVINPDKEAGTLKAEVLLSSLKDTAEVEGVEKIFDWPGEYEIKGIPIVAMQAWTKSRSENEKSKDAEQTLIFCFEMDDMRVCHLGALGHVLTSDMIKAIGDVDVLMINGDKDSNLGVKKAVEVVEAIEPRSIAIMGKETASPLLKELGAEDVEVQEKVTLKSTSSLAEDKRTYFVFTKV